MAIVKIVNVRLAFANLFQPDNKYNRFGASFPIAPGSDNARALEAAVKTVAKEKWGAKADAILTKLRAEGLLAYLQSPKTNGEGQVYDGFVDMHTLNASNKTRPAVIDRDTSPLTSEDGRPYGGCYVDASIDLWAQDNSWGKRINGTLRWVQFRADGESFAGAPPVDHDEFEAIAEGATAGDLV